MKLGSKSQSPSESKALPMTQNMLQLNIIQAVIIFQSKTNIPGTIIWRYINIFYRRQGCEQLPWGKKEDVEQKRQSHTLTGSLEINVKWHQTIVKNTVWTRHRLLQWLFDTRHTVTWKFVSAVSRLRTKNK